MGFGPGSLHDVTQFIQLAVAPIFLLMTVASTLSVLTSRLARIVDRGRHLEAQSSAPRRADEIRTLEKRAQLIYRALTLGVAAALGICVLMTLVFAGELFAFNTARAVAGLFLFSLFAYTAALFCLLYEVFLAVGAFGRGLESARKES